MISMYYLDFMVFFTLCQTPFPEAWSSSLSAKQSYLKLGLLLEVPSSLLVEILKLLIRLQSHAHNLFYIEGLEAEGLESYTERSLYVFKFVARNLRRPQFRGGDL